MKTNLHDMNYGIKSKHAAEHRGILNKHLCNSSRLHPCGYVIEKSDRSLVCMNHDDQERI